MKIILQAIWQFVSYLFWPQWGRKNGEKQKDHEDNRFEEYVK